MREAERRFAEFRQSDDGDELQGVVVKYGDRAQLYGEYTEEIKPGAFRYQLSKMVMNIQHNRSLPLARPDTRFLDVSNDDKSLEMTLRYPRNQEGELTHYARIAKDGVDSGLYRGLSVEMYVPEDGETYEGKHRIIHSADLVGFGLVDIPAYPASTLTRSWMTQVRKDESAAVELRRGRNRLSGQMLWNTISVASMANRRAVQFLPGSLSIPEVVTILHGSDYNRILGATDAGSLVVRATEKGIEFVMKRLPGTQPGKDVSRLIKDRLLKSFRAGYVAEEVEASTVNIMGLEFQLETVKSGILCEIRLSSAPMAAGALNRRYRHLEGLF